MKVGVVMLKCLFSCLVVLDSIIVVASNCNGNEKQQNLVLMENANALNYL